MSDVDWPSPEPSFREPAQRPSPLPRVEDLPIAEQGYDREKVQEAFDAFYRHAAQLDATLRTLESVDVFQRTAAELRAELRTIRGSGLSVGSWQSGAGAGYGARSSVTEWSLPPAASRVAAEALFLIVVGVIVGIAGWPRLTIVLVMALALGIVWLVEWVASRERPIPRAASPAQAPALDEPAELEAAPATSTPQQEGPEAMTILGAPPVREEAEPAQEASHPEPAPEEPVPGDSPSRPGGDSPSEPAPEAVAELDVSPVTEDTAEEFVLMDEAEPAVAEAAEVAVGEQDSLPVAEDTAGDVVAHTDNEPEPDEEREDDLVATAGEVVARTNDEPHPDEERDVGEPQEPEQPGEEREDDLVAAAEELETSPEPDAPLGVAEPIEPAAERRRFRLFRRRPSQTMDADEVVAEHVPGEAPEPAPGAAEPSLGPGPDLEPLRIEPDEPDEPEEPEQRVDPWEQAAAIPQPELDEPERRVDGWEQAAAIPHPEPDEPALEPPPRRSWFRREPQPPLEPEPEPEREPEPVAELEPEPEPEPEEPADLAELPVEALADQAAAALERSRARRRTPRRARRR